MPGNIQSAEEDFFAQYSSYAEAQDALVDALKADEVSTLTKFTAEQLRSTQIEGLSLLHVACFYDAEVCTQYLYNQGLDMHVRHRDGGLSALEMAARHSSRSLAVLLSKTSPEKLLPSSLGQTNLIYHAIINKNLDTFRLLMRDPRINTNQQSSATGDSPFHLICQQGLTDFAEVMLNSQVNLALFNKKGRQALYYAVRDDRWQIVLKAMMTQEIQMTQLLSDCESMKNNTAKQILLKASEDIDSLRSPYQQALINARLVLCKAQRNDSVFSSLPMELILEISVHLRATDWVADKTLLFAGPAKPEKESSDVTKPFLAKAWATCTNKISSLWTAGC